MSAFIDERRAEFGVEPICRTLAVAPSTYYAACSRPPSARALRDRQLVREIHGARAGYRRVYGARKTWRELSRRGTRVGRDRVARLMRAQGLEGVRRGRRPRTTIPAEMAAERARDLVERQFVASRPNELWVADIRQRHSRRCGAPDARCSCSPSYEASTYDRRSGKKIRKSFPTQAAARAWRSEASTAVRKGAMRAPTATTLREAAAAWLAGARDGSIRNRSGDRYKPSAIRGYAGSLDRHVLPEFGASKLGDISRIDVQDLADRLLAAGADPSTIRNTVMPLRVIYRRAVSRGEVAVNPCSGVELPAVRGTRDRIASPGEAAELLGALPEGDRAVWAGALYAGLRAGELAALRWADADLAAGLLHISRGWDPKAEQYVEVKSRAGRRRVPVAAVLRDHLLDHKLRTGGEGEALAFGRPDGRPFSGIALRTRALRSWQAAGLTPITMHECRHTFASLMIAAGVNAKALSTYMGHANIGVTYDRYGHLMPGNEDEAAELLDAYLARADTAARLAQVGS